MSNKRDYKSWGDYQAQYGFWWNFFNDINELFGVKNKQREFDAWQNYLDRENDIYLKWLDLQDSQKERDWESGEKALDRYHNTAQFKIADLRAAGLNPSLAMQGEIGSPISGSSTTSARSQNIGASSQSSALDESKTDILKALIEAGIKNINDARRALARINKTNAKEKQEALKEIKSSMTSAMQNR